MIQITQTHTHSQTTGTSNWGLRFFFCCYWGHKAGTEHTRKQAVASRRHKRSSKKNGPTGKNNEATEGTQTPRFCDLDNEPLRWLLKVPQSTVEKWPELATRAREEEIVVVVVAIIWRPRPRSPNKNRALSTHGADTHRSKNSRSEESSKPQETGRRRRRRGGGEGTWSLTSPLRQNIATWWRNGSEPG